MPCYDKKLEAVRPDFRFGQTVDSLTCKEVDTVLATHELIELLDRQKADLATIEGAVDVEMEVSDDPLTQLAKVASDPLHFSFYTQQGRTSNGYLEFIFRRASLELFGVQIDPQTSLNYKQGKNRHYQEVTFPGVPLKFI